MANSLTHALPFPVTGARYTIPVVYRDGTASVTQPTSPDTEFSTNGGATWADCSEEVSVVDGLGHLTLTGAEMNARCVMVQSKGSGVITEVHCITPHDLPVLRSGTATGGSATTIVLESGASAVDDTYNGCVVRTTGGTGGGGTGGANNQARVVTDYVGSTRTATVMAWEVNPANGTTYDILVPLGWAHAPGVRALLALPAVAPDSSGGLATEDANGLLACDATRISGSAAAADAVEANITNLDAAITSRSTFDGGPVSAVAGDVAGRVLGGGSSTITGTGVRAVSANGDNLVTTDFAQDLAEWVDDEVRGYVDALNDLSDQGVADALKLAPSAGDPAAGSAMEQLDAIGGAEMLADIAEAVQSELAAHGVALTASATSAIVAAIGGIVLNVPAYQASARADRNGPDITRTYGATVPHTVTLTVAGAALDLTDATVEMAVADSLNEDGETAIATWSTADGTLAIADQESGVISVLFPTEVADALTPGDRHYTIEVTLADGMRSFVGRFITSPAIHPITVPEE